MWKRSLMFLLLLSLTLPFTILPVCAADYDTKLPSYVPYSGGAFFEVFDENLGTVTCVFPVDFQNDTFGFNAAGTDVYNLTNSTVNGYVVSANGTVYTARASRLSFVEYRYSTNTSYYTALEPKKGTMKASNINFITDDPDLYNDSYFDRENFIIILLVILCICEASNVLLSLFRRGHKY